MTSLVATKTKKCDYRAFRGFQIGVHNALYVLCLSNLNFALTSVALNYNKRSIIIETTQR